MILYQLDVTLCNSFIEVAEKAKAVAVRKNVIVKFYCAGVICYVDKNTDTDLLLHDYLSQSKLLRYYKELEVLKTQMYGDGYVGLCRPPELATYCPK